VDHPRRQAALPCLTTRSSGANSISISFHPCGLIAHCSR
jgi:hypothetical protein